MPRLSVAAILFLSLIFSSCVGGEMGDISTYTVPRTDFENYIVLEGVVEPVRSTTISCPARVDAIINYIIEDGTFVEQGDTLCVLEDGNLLQYYDDLLTGLENAEAESTKLKANLDMQFAILEAQVQNNAADTKIAQLDSLQLLYSPPNQKKVKELQLERVAIEKARYEKKLEALKIINQSEIRQMEIRIQQLRNNIQSTHEILDGTIMTAPQKGLAIRAIYPVSGQKLKEGDNVWNNMAVIQLPEMDRMKVKFMAPELDYKAINVGDSVVYTFDAEPDNMAYGKITMKSPMGQPVMQGSKVKQFEMEASVDSVLTMPEPGFTVNCRIILQEARDTIVIPQIAIFDRDSAKVVFVKPEGGRGYQMRQVTTGLSSQKEAVVTAGLREGETIMLSEPPPAQVKDELFLPDSVAKPVSDSIPPAAAPDSTAGVPPGTAP